MKNIVTLITALFAVVGLMAQSSQTLWKDISTAEVFSNNTTKSYLPETEGRTLSLDFSQMQSYLKAAPMESIGTGTQATLALEIPFPNGQMRTFEVYEISILAPELAAAYPNIKTYSGQMLNVPSLTVRITTGPLGFNATVMGAGNDILIETAIDGQTDQYVSYHLEDAKVIGDFTCGNHDITGKDEEIVPLSQDAVFNFSAKSAAPVDLRTYRLALATTAEYSQANGGGGGNTAGVLNAVTIVMNQVNGIFEKENAIRLELIPNTTETFYFPPAANDPYENGDAGAMIDVNQIVLDNAYGSDGYDVGHVFGTAPGGGTVGLGSLAAVCNDNIKARGVSNTLGPAGFYQTVAHEFGHQFNATHTFNLCDSDNENPGTGYEPGGGSALMSYVGTGVCGSNAVVQSAEDYFHINSLERIRAFKTGLVGGSCAVVTATSNNTPEANIPIDGGFTIPISTPFELTGEATDAEDDDLLYTWEQYDLGPASPLGTPSLTGNPPLFRSFPPTDDPTRIFPRIQNIVSNNSSISEVLPTTSRDLTFRFTARDCNSEAGGFDFDEIAFASTVNAGPFLVTSPNAGGESWEVGDYVEVTWDVANTDGPQVDCQFVDIYLSTDGGFTYPVTLLANTKNDGSAFVVVPDNVSNAARVKVKARDNIFFDISNQNFSIVAATEADFTVSSYTPECGEVCVPSTFEVTLETASILGFSEMITFSTTNLPTGATVAFSTNPVAPGESTVATFDFSDAAMDGDAEVTIVAEAMGGDTEERIVQFNVVNSDFSALALNEPAGSAISTLPDYDWTDLPNGLSYNIEVATDVDFNNIVDAASGLEDPTYQSSVTLEEGTVYYWRVAVTNECGTGDFGPIGAFKTIAQSCNTTSSTAVLDIPNPNGSMVQSTINIPVGGEISDVNVKSIDGVYNAFGDIVFRLIGPGNTVQLMNQEPCSNPNPFNLGFDDQAALTDIPCPPPSSGSSYRPVQPLNVFNGLDAQGDWILEVEVVTGFGDGGTIDQWDLEICGASVPVDPEVGTNDICVLPGVTSLIPNAFFEITDADNNASEIQITLVSLPEYGFISRNGTELGQGDSFSMADINSSSVTYTNEDDSQLADQFTFIAEDVTGGFLGLVVSDIDIDPMCILDAREQLIGGGKLAVYPNPASDVLNVELLDETLGMEEVAVFNAQGQRVLGRFFDNLMGQTQLQIGHLPTGVYIVQVRTEEGIGTKRVIID
ncbi:MAG: reprolysin-like metallopeptidase [Bacteroidota bacterium]